MTIAAIRKKLVNYVLTAPDKKVKAIYTLIEDEIEARNNDRDTRPQVKAKKNGLPGKN